MVWGKFFQIFRMAISITILFWLFIYLMLFLIFGLTAVVFMIKTKLAILAGAIVVATILVLGKILHFLWDAFWDNHQRTILIIIPRTSENRQN